MAGRNANNSNHNDEAFYWKTMYYASEANREAERKTQNSSNKKKSNGWETLIIIYAVVGILMKLGGIIF